MTLRSYSNTSHGVQYFSPGWCGLAQLALACEWLMYHGWTCPRYSDGTTTYTNRLSGQFSPTSVQCQVKGLPNIPGRNAAQGGFAYETDAAIPPPNTTVHNLIGASAAPHAWIEMRAPDGSFSFTLQPGTSDASSTTAVRIKVTWGGDFATGASATTTGTPAALVTGTGDSFAKTGSTIVMTDAATTFSQSNCGQFITIAGATTAGNNGTFAITAYSGNTVTWTNASGATEAYAGTWSLSCPDEYVIIGGKSDADAAASVTGSFGSTGALASDLSDLYMSLDDEAPYGFAIVIKNKSTATNAIAFTFVHDPVNASASDTAPSVAYCASNFTIPGNFAGTSTLGPVGWLAKGGGGAIRRLTALYYRDSVASTVIPGDMPVGQDSLKHQLYSIPYVRNVSAISPTTPVGSKGSSTFLGYMGSDPVTGNAGTPIEVGTRMTVADPAYYPNWRVVGNVVMPWADTTAWAADASGGLTLAAEFVNLEGPRASDTTAPVIANLVPADLAELAADDFIEFDLYDDEPGVTFAQLLISLSNNPRRREAVYDAGEFWGLFARDSIYTAGAGTLASPHHFKIRPAGGWPAGVTVNLLPRFVDGVGNQQVAP